MSEKNQKTEKQEKSLKKRIVENFSKTYEKDYKKLLIIPFLILLLSLASLGYKYASEGEFFNKDVSLSGGVVITINTQEIEASSVEQHLLSEFPGSDILVRTITSLGEQAAITVASSDLDSDTLLKSLTNAFGTLDYSIEEMGPTLGQSFFRETFIAVLFAFIFMAGVVFFYFRQPVPSLVIMLSAVSNMIVTISVINLLGVRLSTAGIAAFLMLIGYSVDTNILLSTKVLKRKGGTVSERVLGGMGTGLVMTATTLTAIIIAFTFSQSDSLKQIMLILMIGLMMDVLNTWIQNAGILRLYLERKAKNAKS